MWPFAEGEYAWRSQGCPEGSFYEKRMGRDEGIVSVVFEELEDEEMMIKQEMKVLLKEL